MVSSCGTVDGVIFSWGDTDTRYAHDQEPDNIVDHAFRYPAWKGERVFAQAVLYVSEEVRDVRLYFSDLVSEDGVIPESSIEVGFVKYVWADDFIDGYRQCGYRNRHEQDSLLVADMVDIATRTDIQAEHCQPVWLTVSVPSTAPAGKYSGKLKVRGRGMKTMELPIELQVIDDTLPSPHQWKFHLDLWQNPYSVARVHDVGLWSQEHFDYMRPVMQKLADAGQKVITATIMNRPWNGQTEDPFDSMVSKTMKENGEWEYGYEVFDKWVEFMMSLGIDRQINCYTLIPWNLEFDYFDEVSGQMKTLKAEPGSSDYKLYWVSFISDFAAHLRAKGWFEKTCIAMDERTQEAMNAALETIADADPEFRVSFAGNWHQDIETEIFDYCVAFRHPMPKEVIQRRRSEGRKSTYYTCCAEKYPNLFTVSPLVEAVWIPWYALANDYDGFLRWAYNHWTADPLHDTRFRTWTSGDCYCIYPEGRSSLRFDKLVEGIQDYEKAVILREKWADEGDIRKLEAFDEVLKAFDFDTISKEGASDAVHMAKAFIRQHYQ